jgi:molecular chaperone GrpE (heat shock protein)
LIQQIGNYRNACIDATRRVGILPYEAQAGEPFDIERHEIADGSEPTPGATVERTVAWGYTFQGVVIRRIQVAIAAMENAATEN